MDPKNAELLKILEMIADLKAKLVERQKDLQSLRNILHSSLDGQDGSMCSYALAIWTEEFLELDYEIESSEELIIEAHTQLSATGEQLKKAFKKGELI